ncbi:MAG TPA: hypothetical protein PKB14_01785 [Rubrivivax sp.]|nr:hypothetical protein [Rubrivivax sp.]
MYQSVPSLEREGLDSVVCNENMSAPLAARATPVEADGVRDRTGGFNDLSSLLK